MDAPAKGKTVGSPDDHPCIALSASRLAVRRLRALKKRPLHSPQVNSTLRNLDVEEPFHVYNDSAATLCLLMK